MQQIDKYEALEELAPLLQRTIKAVRGIAPYNSVMILTIRLKLVLSFFKMKKADFEQRAEVLGIHSMRVIQSSHPSAFQDETQVIEEIITFLATRMIQRGDFNQLIDALVGINLPFATFFISECYRRMNASTSYNETFQRTLELLSKLDKHPLKYIVDGSSPRACTLLNTHRLSDHDHPIIGMVWDDNTVTDSDGQIRSVDEYLNKVTPRKTGLTRLLYENFTDNLIQSDFIDSSSAENHETAVEKLAEHVQAVEPSSENSEAVEQAEAIMLNDNVCSKKKSHGHSENIKKKIHQDLSRVCPIRGCDRIIKHYSSNASRHIKEFHGQQLNGKWVLKRYKCTECNEKNIVKLAKRPDNLKPHYERCHQDQTFSTMPEYIPLEKPLEYKEEYDDETL